jgi:hypothetical protein
MGAPGEYMFRIKCRSTGIDVVHMSTTGSRVTGVAGVHTYDRITENG